MKQNVYFNCELNIFDKHRQTRLSFAASKQSAINLYKLYQIKTGRGLSRDWYMYNCWESIRFYIIRVSSAVSSHITLCVVFLKYNKTNHKVTKSSL
jgi:hypothetical protein